jgi:hypothetical protein
MQLTPVRPALDPPALPFRFAIAIGVRKSDAELRERLERALARRRAEIERVLQQYGVPHEASPQQTRKPLESRRHSGTENSSEKVTGSRNTRQLKITNTEASLR